MSQYTVKEVTQITGIPATTLRYYDKEGLLPNISRKESGYRLFSDSDIMMLRVIECLKNTGMQIKEIREFSNYVQMGDESLNERYRLFQERRKIVVQQMADLQKMLNLIDHKCWYYKTAIEAGTESIHSDLYDPIEGESDVFHRKLRCE